MASLEPDALAAKARLVRVGVAAALISRIFGRLVGVVLVVVLAREGNPATVALYGFLLGTVTLMASLTDLGVASLASRDVASGIADPKAALRSALGPQALSIGLAVGLTCLVAILAGPAGVDTRTLVPCSVFVVANGLFNLWAEMLRGAGRVILEGVLQGISAMVLVIVGSLVVMAGAGIAPLLWVVAGKELLVLALAAVVLWPRTGTDVGPGFGALLRRSVWLAVAGSALVVLWRQGTLLVSAEASTRVLADYIVATRVLDATVTLAYTLGIGLFPGVAALAHQAPQAARRHVGRYLLGVLGASALVGALGVLLAAPVTTALFGSQWHSAVDAVRVLAVTAPLIMAAYLLCFALLAERQERWLCLGAVSGASAAVMVTAALLAITPSAVAAALGTAVGAVILVVILSMRFFFGERCEQTRPGSWHDEHSRS